MSAIRKGYRLYESFDTEDVVDTSNTLYSNTVVNNPYLSEKDCKYVQKEVEYEMSDPPRYKDPETIKHINMFDFKELHDTIINMPNFVEIPGNGDYGIGCEYTTEVDGIPYEARINTDWRCEVEYFDRSVGDYDPHKDVLCGTFHDVMLIGIEIKNLNTGDIWNFFSEANETDFYNSLFTEEISSGFSRKEYTN